MAVSTPAWRGSGEESASSGRTMRKAEQRNVWEEGKGGRQTSGSCRPHNVRQEAEQPQRTSTPAHGRQRNFRFSREENMVLITKLSPVYEQLLGKQKSTIPLFRKTQMWQDICDAVNRVGRRQRHVQHCKKRFSDIKRQLLNKLDRERCYIASGGRYYVHFTQYEQELQKFLPEEVIEIEVLDTDLPLDGPFRRKLQILPSKLNSFSDSANHHSEPESVQTPLNLATLLDEQWNLLPPLCSTYTAESGGSTTHPIESQPKLLNPSPSRSEVTKLQPPPPPSPAPSTLPNVQPSSKQLKMLKATQWLLRKGITHNLNVLHLDIQQLTQRINENHAIAKNILSVQTQSNSILSQMNQTMGEVAESIQLLVNQQQAERILLDDSLGIQSGRKKRGGPSRCPETRTSALRSQRKPS